MTESKANKSTLHRLTEAVLCVAAVVTLVAVKCAASNVNFAFDLSPDREQGGHNLVLASQLGSDATFDASEPPADDDYNPEKDLEEQEKSRQKPRGSDTPPKTGNPSPRPPESQP